MSTSDKDLKYTLSAKDTFLVISFSGKMTRAAASELEACLGEVQNRSEENVVLNFSEVAQIDRPLIPSLVKLQKAIRDRNKTTLIRICHLKNDLGAMLVDTGAIRRDELKSNLEEALFSFKPQKLAVKSIIKSAA